MLSLHGWNMRKSQEMSTRLSSVLSLEEDMEKLKDIITDMDNAFFSSMNVQDAIEEVKEILEQARQGLEEELEEE